MVVDVVVVVVVAGDGVCDICCNNSFNPTTESMKHNTCRCCGRVGDAVSVAAVTMV